MEMITEMATDKKTETVTKTNCRNCGRITDKEFCSDICREVYNRKPKGAKPLQAIEEQNKVQKYCKNCNKELPKGLNADYCSSKCIKEYRFKKEHPDKTMKDVYGNDFVKNGESEESATEYMRRRQKEKKSGKNTEQKEVRNNGLDEPVFWHTGEGMSRRSRNINTVKDLILKGLSYNQIWNIAGEFFTSKKFDEYYTFALNKIEMEKAKNES